MFNLITINENNEFVGYLAESWNYVEGSDTKIAFKLKEGVKFHDGSTLTFSTSVSIKHSSMEHLCNIYSYTVFSTSF